MLDAKAVAQLLGLSARAVYDIPVERLPRYRVGAGSGAVRFAPSDVEAYLESCRSTATKPEIGGATSTPVSLVDADDALRSYFQRRGLAPKRKPTPERKTTTSTPLRLVPSESSR
jgi:predicted DNA-binding transcriptional regulator AlpA